MTPQTARRTEMPRDHIIDATPQSQFGPHHLHLEPDPVVDRFVPCNVTACDRPMYRQGDYLICVLDPGRMMWSQEQIVQSQIDSAWERRPVSSRRTSGSTGSPKCDPPARSGSGFRTPAGPARCTARARS